MDISNTSSGFPLRDVLQNAIAQQRFEGLSPSDDVIQDLEQVITGSMTIDIVIANIGKRYRHVKIRG
jgi:Antitoxin VbhA